MTTVTVNVPATTVQVPASTVQYALQLNDCLATLTAAGYVCTLASAPPPPPPPPPPPAGKLTVTANAFSVKVDFPGYVAPAGKTLASVSAKGTGNAAFMTGSDSHFPFLVEGVNGSWPKPGGPMTIAVTATFMDGTTAALGSATVTLEATDGSVVPENGLGYSNGVVYFKGEFDFGGVKSSWYNTDKDGTYIRVQETTGGGGHQPYWPVSATQGVDWTKFKNLTLVVKPDIDAEFNVSCMSNNDVQDGVSVVTSLAKAGVLTTLTISLSQLKLGASLLKFSVGTSVNEGKSIGFNIYGENLTS